MGRRQRERGWREWSRRRAADRVLHELLQLPSLAVDFGGVLDKLALGRPLLLLGVDVLLEVEAHLGLAAVERRARERERGDERWRGR
jgi:hypothetical protein